MSNYSWAFTIKDAVTAPLQNMATAIGTASTKAAAFEVSLTTIGKQSAKIAPSVSSIGAAFGSLGGAASTALAGLGLQQLGGEVVKTLSEFERMGAVLTNTLGSSSAAKGVMAGITDFAAKTPFQVDELTNSFVKLANQGFAPNMSELTKLGDLASSTGKGFDMLTEAVIDAQVGEFERLKEFGIQAKKSNGEVAFTFKNQTKVVKESAGEIRSYLLSLGNMKGVGGAMAAISATTGGQISNMKDQIDQFKLAIGTTLKPIVVDTLGTMTTYLTSGALWVKENKTQIQAWIPQVMSLGKSVLSVYVAFKAWNLLTTGLTLTRNLLISMGGAVVRLGLGFASASVSALGFIANAVIGVGSLAVSLGTAITAQLGLNLAMLANPIGVIVAGVVILGAAFYGLFKLIDTAFPNFFSTVKEWFGKAFDFVYNTFIKPIKEFFSFLVTALAGTNEAMKTTTVAEDPNDPFTKFKKNNPLATGFDFAKNAVGGGKKMDLGVDKKEGKITGSGANVKNINQTIHKLVEKVEIHVTNVAGKLDLRELQEQVTRALMGSANDFNYQ